MPDPQQTIAYQGVPGAYSHLACTKAYPKTTAVACASFEEAFQAVEEGRLDLAMIPVENSTAGRIADIHHLLPATKLHIVAEHYQPVHHCLLGVKGAQLTDVKLALSHSAALAQCRDKMRQHNLTPVTVHDTAGAAQLVAEQQKPEQAAIASQLAAETYGLDVLVADMRDAEHNTTRFVVLSRKEQVPAMDMPCKTTFTFAVRSIPAALYKALGGFATNGVNITRLESFLVDGAFTVAQFYADVEGHPAQENMRLALEELEFFSSSMRILGVYPQQRLQK